MGLAIPCLADSVASRVRTIAVMTIYEGPARRTVGYLRQGWTRDEQEYAPGNLANAPPNTGPLAGAMECTGSHY